MRTTILCLIVSMQAIALDNAVRITDRTGAAQSARPFTIGWVFAEDEICNFPQPFTGGAGLAVWQVDNVNRWPASAVCPGGSVQRADISFAASVPANGTLAVDFRNNANPCSAGNRAACDATGLDTVGMLTFNGGAWATDLRVTANPQGSTTSRTFNARTALAAGRWRYWLRGPAVTRVIVGDSSTARVDDFGFKEKRITRITQTFLDNDTVIPVDNTTNLAGLARPFIVEADGEQMSVCFVTATSLIVGLANGTSSSCADVAGRGRNGTLASYHSSGTHGNYIRSEGFTNLTADLSGNGPTSITVADASAINSPTILQVQNEQLRVCNKSGNVLTVGTGGWGCSPDNGGRSWRGTNGAFGAGIYAQGGTLVYNMDTMADRWVDAPADMYKSLHPEAVLTFHAGWPGVGIAYHLNNYWTNRMQDQVYDLEIRKGAASTAYSLAEIKQISRTRLRFPVWNTAERMFWDGSEPGEVRYDYNHRYKKSAGIVPHDPAVTLTAEAVDNELFVNTSTASLVEPAWVNSDKCEPDTYTTLNGPWRIVKGPASRNIPDAGGRPDIGLFTRWAGTAVLSWASTLPNSHRLNEVMQALGVCAGMLPVHYNEGNTGKKFCDGGSYPANPADKSCTGDNRNVDEFGRPASIDARPTAVPFNQANSDGADRYTPVGIATNNTFVFNTGTISHMPSLSFLPWVTTGDPFFQDELVHFAAFVAANGGEIPLYYISGNTERINQRHGDWGYLWYRDGIRSRAWAMRDLGLGAWAAPDGSAVKEYLTAKLNRNLAFDEGKYLVTNGSFHIPCPVPLGTRYDDSPWCFGYTYKGMESNLTTVYPMEIGSFAVDGESDPQYTFSGDSPWMRSYYYTALGQLENIGFRQVRGIRTAVMKGLLDRIKRPDFNPFLLGNYREPVTPCLPEGVPQPGGCAGRSILAGSQWAFSSYQALMQAIKPEIRGRTGFLNDSDLQSGYAQLSRAGASWLPDGVATPAGSGDSAWHWMNGNIRYQDLYGSNPHWAFSPRGQINNLRVTPGDTSIRFVGDAFTADGCRLAVNSSPFASWDDSGDPALPMSGRGFSHVASGLSAGTAYYWRITCGPQGGVTRKIGVATTVSTGGTSLPVSMELKPPPGRGVADAVVDFGPTSGLGQSVTVSCASGCVANLTGVANRPLFYRVTYRNSGGGVVASGVVQSLMGS